MNATLPEKTLTLIDELLAEQRTLTAVERFSRHHDRNGQSAKERLYRELMPARSPVSGEQYAFQVDLDACSGCKACVAGCHSLNGLEENETWRSVGFLHGDEEGNAFQQTVTTACHHCLDPGCLTGCPVKAYDKDSVTGIVRHLDDQCIGCQYCVMKCPYEVPKYSEKLGIVRKCDMCVGRLAVGEAPACVQSCPTAAISITLVKQDEIKARFHNGESKRSFLSDSPDPQITLPTTLYLSKRALNGKALAADHNAPRLENPHWPLVVMLIFTQAAAGMFLGATMVPTTPVLNAVAFGLLNIGLLSAPFHLGQPLKAWRAFLGWRTSWLSREIIALSMFALLAVAAAALAWQPILKEAFPRFGELLQKAPPLEKLQLPLTILAALGGLAGVFVSSMVYVDTNRACWSPRHSFGNFFGTTLLLGAALAAATFAWLSKFNFTQPFAVAALMIGAALFVWRRLELRMALKNPDSPIHLNALAIRKLLPRTTPARTALFAASTIFGLLTIANIAGLAVIWANAAAFSTLVSEVIVRYVFFAAGTGKRMPGGIAA